MVKYKIGHCDNPLSRTERLFPNQYFLRFNGGVSKNKKETGLNLVELHFQLFEEIPSKADFLENYVKILRKNGIELSGHMPFLIDKNGFWFYKPLNFDFIWPIVPSQYKNKEVMVIEKLKINAREGKMAEYKRVVSLMGKLGIKILTMHVSKFGAVLNRLDWNKFMIFFRELNRYALDRGVVIAVETGGILNEYIEDVIGAGGKINFDVAHYFMDMISLGKSEKKANELTFKAYKKYCKSVPIIHLSQTMIDYDAHLGLLDRKGALTCNEKILRHMKKEKGFKYIVLETHPDKKAIEYVKGILGKQ